MTRARTASYGVVTPPPLDRWIDAVLMLFASLVQGVAATFGMRRWIGKRDWHTHSEATVLPQTKPDIQNQKDTQLTDLPVRLPREGGDPVSARSALPASTALTPLIRANAGIQGRPCALFRLAASSLRPQANRSWIPTFVGMSGASCEIHA